jgi:hypothetical protein
VSVSVYVFVVEISIARFADCVCHARRLILLALILWSLSGYLICSVHERSKFLL